MQVLHVFWKYQLNFLKNEKKMGFLQKMVETLLEKDGVS